MILDFVFSSYFVNILIIFMKVNFIYFSNINFIWLILIFLFICLINFQYNDKNIHLHFSMVSNLVPWEGNKIISYGAIVVENYLCTFLRLSCGKIKKKKIHKWQKTMPWKNSPASHFLVIHKAQVISWENYFLMILAMEK